MHGERAHQVVFARRFHPFRPFFNHLRSRSRRHRPHSARLPLDGTKCSAPYRQTSAGSATMAVSTVSLWQREHIIEHALATSR